LETAEMSDQYPYLLPFHNLGDVGLLKIGAPGLSADDYLKLAFKFGSANTAQYYPYYPDPATEQPALSLRILVRLIGPRTVGVDGRHFTGSTRIFLAWCNICKRYYYDYAHGFERYVLCGNRHSQLV